MHVQNTHQARALARPSLYDNDHHNASGFGYRSTKSTAADDGYVVERDSEVAKDEPGPHNGLGQSTGYIFFEKVPT